MRCAYIGADFVFDERKKREVAKAKLNKEAADVLAKARAVRAE